MTYKVICYVYLVINLNVYASISEIDFKNSSLTIQKEIMKHEENTKLPKFFDSTASVKFYSLLSNSISIETQNFCMFTENDEYNDCIERATYFFMHNVKKYYDQFNYNFEKSFYKAILESEFVSFSTREFRNIFNFVFNEGYKERITFFELFIIILAIDNCLEEFPDEFLVNIIDTRQLAKNILKLS